MRVTERSRWDLDEDLISKYEPLDVLGGGGMGRVLRARHRQLKRLVAIKLLQQDLKASEAVTRFLREARAAAQIRGPHVAHVMDAGILRNGRPYIVMEYLQGQDLSRLIAARGRLPIEQAVGFILQALEALAEAHTLKIIHRDIKPGNLFATRGASGDTWIKIVDFGLAKTSQALDTLDPGVTERGAVLGTPSYMSPEQFVDAQDVDARADIWGIGATLFELLTGVPPFNGGNLPQVYAAVMHQPLPSIRKVVPDLPAALDRVVATCLTRDRAERYVDVAELAAALAPFAGPSARDQIQRIERIVHGGLDHATVDADAPASADDSLELLIAPSSHPKRAHSALAREDEPARARSQRPAPLRRGFRLWLSIGILLLTALALWQYARSPAAPNPAKQPASQRASGMQPKSISEVPPATRSEPAPITLPAPTHAPEPVTTDPPKLAAPAVRTVSPPTAPKKRRPKVSLPTSYPSSNSEIYEQYP